MDFKKILESMDAIQNNNLAMTGTGFAVNNEVTEEVDSTVDDFPEESSSDDENREPTDDELRDIENECNYCGGTGEQFAECPGGCNGHGCEECHGLGYDKYNMVPCEDCEGTGKKIKITNKISEDYNNENSNINVDSLDLKINKENKKDKNLDIVQKVCKQFFVKTKFLSPKKSKHGNDTILSFNVGIKGFHFDVKHPDKNPYSSFAKMPIEEKNKLKEIKKQFLETCISSGVPKNAVNVKFHFGKGLYANVSVKLHIAPVAKNGPEENSPTTDKEQKSTIEPTGQSFVGKGIYEGKKKVNECISWNLSVDSNGEKHASISADGDEADQLLSILRLSGITGEKSIIPEAKVEVDNESAGEHINEPDEQILDAHTQLVDLSDGPNKPHEQVNRFNKGDNAMAMSRAMENLENSLRGKFKKMLESDEVVDTKKKNPGLCPHCGSKNTRWRGLGSDAKCESCGKKYIAELDESLSPEYLPPEGKSIEDIASSYGYKPTGDYHNSTMGQIKTYAHPTGHILHSSRSTGAWNHVTKDGINSFGSTPSQLQNIMKQHHSKSMISKENNVIAPLRKFPKRTVKGLGESKNNCADCKTCKSKSCKCDCHSKKKPEWLEKAEEKAEKKKVKESFLDNFRDRETSSDEEVINYIFDITKLSKLQVILKINDYKLVKKQDNTSTYKNEYDHNSRIIIQVNWKTHKITVRLSGDSDNIEKINNVIKQKLVEDIRVNRSGAKCSYNDYSCKNAARWRLPNGKLVCDKHKTKDNRKVSESVGETPQERLSSLKKKYNMAIAANAPNKRAIKAEIERVKDEIKSKKVEEALFNFKDKRVNSFGMPTQEGNDRILEILKQSSNAKLNWPETYAMIEHLAMNRKFRSATTTEVRNAAYKYWKENSNY